MHGHGVKINAGKATCTIRYILEDPEGLTGTEQTDWSVAGAGGHNLMELAIGSDINIEHACGGVCACSTCHVYIEKGEELLSEPTEAEEDRVEEAPGLQRNSRLSCQCEIERPGEIVVRVPAWNRNAIKEVPH